MKRVRICSRFVPLLFCYFATGRSLLFPFVLQPFCCSLLCARVLILRCSPNSYDLSIFRKRKAKQKEGENRRARTRSARHAKTPLFYEISRLLPWFISNALCFSPVISPLQNLSYRLLRLYLPGHKAHYFSSFIISKIVNQHNLIPDEDCRISRVHAILHH